MANYHQNLESALINETSRRSEPRSLKLTFLTGVASPLFTGKKIRGEGGGGGNESIVVVLVDSQTHQKVNSGPAASATVKLVLLPEDFGGTTTGGGGVWTPIEFKNNIVTDWGNKKNLLVGDRFLVLKYGSGIVGEIKIKHDRNYLSKVRFRLGAMVVDCSYEVKEAISDPFEIKDVRNELINKNRSLSLTDKVWQLKNIGKKGPLRKRLERAKIVTVKDFLDMLSSNTPALQEIYGSNGKKWEMTVRHAKTCIDHNMGNLYRTVGSISQRWNNVDHDGCKDLNVETYRPGLLSDDTMTVGEFPSTQCIEECLEILSLPGNHWFEPCQAYQEDGTFGASTMVGGGGGVEGDMAHKRWIKLSRVWFSVRSFTKNVRGASAGATLVGKSGSMVGAALIKEL